MECFKFCKDPRITRKMYKLKYFIHSVLKAHFHFFTPLKYNYIYKGVYFKSGAFSAHTVNLKYIFELIFEVQ